MIGKPQRGELSLAEITLLYEAYIGVPSTEVMFYPGLCLSKYTTIMARSKARTTKRDNSCLAYLDKTSTRCWGVLEKVFAFNNGSTSEHLCLLSTLSVAQELCNDDVTFAKFQSHYVACNPPWLATNIIMYFIAPYVQLEICMPAIKGVITFPTHFWSPAAGRDSSFLCT